MSLRPGLGGAALMLLFLAGCGRPEVTACEQFIKAQLDSPASYQRATVRTMDRVLSPEAFYKAAGRQIETYGPASQKQIRSEKYAVRTVRIDYDSTNPYGVSIRGTDTCQFRLRDGVPSIPDMDLAIGQHEIRRAAVAMVGPPIVKPETPCCLS